MRILYISVHSVLEYDELRLFTELGHECFSLGAYTYPEGHPTLPRPGIPGMVRRDDLIQMVSNKPRTELPEDFLNQFDVIIIMDGYHAPDVVERNWPKLKGKKVVWRTIGQSTPEVENRMKRFRNEGLRIVRYSPMEEEMENYIGKDTMIRFYKDPEEYKGWIGHTHQIMNLSQSLKARRNFCGYDIIMKVLPGFPFKVYGSGNDDLGEFNGGELSYEVMKGALRDCKVFFYSGTWPASYTLSFIEAMMTGIPMVCVGQDIWKHKDHPRLQVYEVPHIIRQGDTGYCSNDPEALKNFVTRLMENRELAETMSTKAREDAIRLFGKEAIAPLWQQFLETI